LRLFGIAISIFGFGAAMSRFGWIGDLQKTTSFPVHVWHYQKTAVSLKQSSMSAYWIAWSRLDLKHGRNCSSTQISDIFRCCPMQ